MAMVREIPEAAHGNNDDDTVMVDSQKFGSKLPETRLVAAIAAAGTPHEPAFHLS